MKQTIEFDMDLIKRYDVSGPRYTSYPTAVQFTDQFGEADYRKQAEAGNSQSGKPLSLYFHIPFCDTVCFYCACNKIATKDRSKGAPYLERVFKDIAMQGALFDNTHKVDQLHWGGGTPTFISHAEMTQLMDKTREHFNLHDDDTGEYSIEVDPREADADTVKVLRKLGFNRLSMGVQDFEPAVQKAVNRIQPESITLATLEAARSEGFKSISLDLIYGLPLQTAKTFERTVQRAIEFGTDRMSIFNYAHLPEMFKPQRRINVEELPSSTVKLEILKNTIDQLTDAGYVYIGMDHFAKPDDELAVAQREGTLYRNFQGYSTHAECDLIGLGVTSIGMVGDSYSQNVKTLDEYYACIDEGRFPILRGFTLDADDKLRREVITQLICHFSLNKQTIEQQYQITFDDYFKIELEQLKSMQDDGLLALSSDKIEVQPAGRLLIRNICMIFDKYLREKKEQRFSKVI